MSQSSSVKFKQWATDIQSGHLHRINQEIKNYTFQENEENTSKSMMKLLIYLCQTVTKFPGGEQDKGREAYDLCKTICKYIKIITNTANFFSSLYHIIRVLLDMELFTKAMKINDHLLPDSIWHEEMEKERSDIDGKYVKLWSIFYASIDKHLKSKRPGSLTGKTFQEFLGLIEYQLNIELLSNPDGSKGILLKLLHYSDLFESAQCTKEQLDEFNDKFFINYLSTTKLTLGIKNKLQTYQYFIKIITKMALPQIKNKRVDVLRDYLRKFIRIFKECSDEDREIRSSFEHCMQFRKIFIRSYADFSTQNPEDIKELTEMLKQHIDKYGTEGAIKYNIYAFSSIFDALFALWTESFFKSSKEPLNNLIMNTTEMLDYHSQIIAAYKSGVPCTCSSCRATDDQNKAAHFKMKNLNFLQRFFLKSEFSFTLLDQFKDLYKKCVDILGTLQMCNCKNWKNMWYYVGNSIYSLAVHLGPINYKTSEELYLLLCESIMSLKATTPETTIFKNNSTPALSGILHRLSNLHYSNSNYTEAKKFAALNVYLHPREPECKGYRNWAFVKYHEHDVRAITLVNFLENIASELETLKDLGKLFLSHNSGHNLNHQDKKEICLRELKTYAQLDLDIPTAVYAVMDCLDKISPRSLTFAKAVHRMCYYLLNFPSEESPVIYLADANKEISKAKVKSNTDRDYLEYLSCHVKFYKIIDEIDELEIATCNEMADTKFKLYASDSTAQNDKTANIVPTYSQINVLMAKEIASKFEDLYNLWKKVLVGDSFVKWNSEDGTSTLRCVIIAGEYCKLYRYTNLEIKFWKLAYNLATTSKDYRYLVHVVGRSIMSRYINDNWIKEAENIISTQFKESKDAKVLSTIAMFKMSLSDYYYYIGNKEKAAKLFEEGEKVTTLDMGTNPGTFIFSKYIVLTHRFHNYPDDKKNNLEYARIIAPTLYGMLTSDDMLKSMKNRERYSYEMDLLLEITCQFAVRMNALYSYREISAHLMRRLSMCQRSLAILRVAEILKYLCIIDLSRHQLDDCEVKLQGLEHILKIETFEMSMQSDNLKTANDILSTAATFQEQALLDPIRDLPVNDTSPVLRREQFAQPQFITHQKDCECFRCTNETYKFLVFSCTHIRAQLYNLRNLPQYARQHFEGAFKISETLLDLSRKEDNHLHGQIIDYTLFCLDYARFLKRYPRSYEEGQKYVCFALEICDIYSLVCHPVYMSAIEIVLEYRFESVFRDGFPKGKLIVPTPAEIEASNELEVEDSGKFEGLCVTPTRDIGDNQRPVGSPIPRRNLGPLLTLSKVSGQVHEIDDEEISPYPKKRVEKPKKKVISKVKPIRRKLDEDDDFHELSQRKSGTLSTDSAGSSSSSSIDKDSKDFRPRLDTLINQIMSLPIPASTFHKIQSFRRRSDDRPVNDEELEEMLDILDESNYRRPISRGKTRREVDDMIDMLQKMLSNSNTSTITKTPDQSCSKTLNVTDSRNRNSSELAVQELTKEVEKLSVKPSTSSNVPSIKVDTIEIVDSDDEVVECSIIEPRRSRRLAGKKTTTDTKLTRKRL